MVKPVKKIEVHRTDEQLKTATDDVFLDKAYDARNYVMQNIERFKKYGYYIAFVAVAIVAYFMYNSEINKEANSQLGIAMIDIRTENFDKAEEKLTILIDEYSGTEAADRATYLLGKILLNKGLIQAAKDRFSAYRGSDPLFTPAAQAGLALCYEKEKNYQAAAELYEKAAGNESRFELVASYLFAAGVNYELAKDNASAKSVYQNLIENHDNFSKKAIVEMKLKQL
ncbi:MAG: tetratricopeptide repeat protein [Calditrichaeota bacterium]|nr:tetratricopeptide repeat protein [Calditrichota bacterium]